MKQILFALLLILVGCQKQAIHNEPKQKPSRQILTETPDSIPQVTIGTQTWMVKNLDVDHYANGDIIPQITDDIAWDTAHIGAWCWYLNDTKLGKTYGRLYNYAAMRDLRSIAPIGWHVPHTNEWGILFQYLGSNYVDQIIEAGNVHWSIGSTATNSSGFTALPSGCRVLRNGQSFFGLGTEAHWWLSVEFASGADISWTYIVPTFQYEMAPEVKWSNPNRAGFAIRCIKD